MPTPEFTAMIVNLYNRLSPFRANARTADFLMRIESQNKDWELNLPIPKNTAVMIQTTAVFKSQPVDEKQQDRNFAKYLLGDLDRIKTLYTPHLTFDPQDNPDLYRTVYEAKVTLVRCLYPLQPKNSVTTPEEIFDLNALVTHHLNRPAEMQLNETAQEKFVSSKSGEPLFAIYNLAVIEEAHRQKLKLANIKWQLSHAEVTQKEQELTEHYIKKVIQTLAKTPAEEPMARALILRDENKILTHIKETVALDLREMNRISFGAVETILPLIAIKYNFKLAFAQALKSRQQFVDYQGYGVLHYMARYGRTDFLSLVTQNGLDLNYLTVVKGVSPLEMAGIAHQYHFIQALCSFAIAKDKEDNTIAHLAMQQLNVEWVKIMMRANVSFTRANKIGNTPIHILFQFMPALLEDLKPILKLLSRSAESVNAMVKLCVEKNRMDIREFLERDCGIDFQKTLNLMALEGSSPQKQSVPVVKSKTFPQGANALARLRGIDFDLKGETKETGNEMPDVARFFSEGYKKELLEQSPKNNLNPKASVFKPNK